MSLKSDTANAANTSGQNATSAFRGAMGGYQSMYANPGYTPGQQSAITSGTLAPIGAAGGAAQQGLYDTAARTRNSAGVTGGADAIARSRMQALGQGGNQVASQIADASRSDQRTALQGEASLYAPSLQSQSSLYNTAAEERKNALSMIPKVGWSSKGGLSLSS